MLDTTRGPASRPVLLSGETERVRTGHGNLYITVNTDDAGAPFELFSTLGKAGGCNVAQLEALSRLASLLLRSGVSPMAIVEQLEGITCCPLYDNGVLIKSPADAVGMALRKRMGNRGIADP